MTKKHDKNKNHTSKSKSSNDEIRIYGENACLKVFENRPEDIIQLHFSKSITQKSPELLRKLTTYLASNKKAYHMISRDELSLLTKATHHEDITLLVKSKKQIKLPDYLKLKKESSLLILIEDVSNPHNIGAMIRTAAHFGVDGIIMTAKKMAETASSIRVSEGGFEHVNLFEVNEFKATLNELKKLNYQIITTSSHAKKTLHELKWSKKAVIVFGQEADGITEDLLKLGDSIKIDGTNHVESLNVSVAASIMMYDYFSKIKLR